MSRDTNTPNYLVLLDVSNYIYSVNVLDHLNAHPRLPELLAEVASLPPTTYNHPPPAVGNLLKEMDAFKEVRKQVRADLKSRFLRLVHIRFPEAEKESISLHLVYDGGHGNYDALRLPALMAKMAAFAAEGRITLDELNLWLAENQAREAEKLAQAAALALAPGPEDPADLPAAAAAAAGSVSEPPPSTLSLGHPFLTPITAVLKNIAAATLTEARVAENACPGPYIAALTVAGLKADEVILALSRRFRALRPAPAGVLVLSDDTDLWAAWEDGARTCPVSPRWTPYHTCVRTCTWHVTLGRSFCFVISLMSSSYLTRLPHTHFVCCVIRSYNTYILYSIQ